MKRVFLLLCLTLPLMLETSPALSEIYRCVDENGNVRYTAQPGPGCELLPGSVEKTSPSPPDKVPPKRPKKKKKSVLTAIPASKLHSDYAGNELAADRKYKGKRLTISGKVYSVEKTLGKPYITLKAGYWGSIICGFDKKYTPALATLDIGETIVIMGICTGKTLTFVHLKQCRIVSGQRR